MDDDDDDLIINDKSLHYTRREYEDSETIQNNDNNVDNCESRKNSKVITSLKKHTPYSPIIEASGTIKKIIRNYS